MDVTQEWDELMDDYLSDKLDNHEKEKFEQRLSSDKSFATAFDLHKQLVRGIEVQNLKDALSQLQSTHQKITKKSIFSINKTVLSLAASLLLLVIAFYFLGPGQNKADQVFTSFYKADHGLPTMMGATDKVTLNDAMVDYKRGLYQSAFHKFTSQLTSSPQNDTLEYYAGLSALGNDDVSNALLYLQTVSENSVFYPRAEWYQALAHLKGNEVDKARGVIESIASSNNHMFYEEALEAMRMLSD